MNLRVESMNRPAGLIPRLCELRAHWTAALLVLATWQGSVFAQSSNGVKNEAKVTSVFARHVIGLEGARKNARGQLTVANDGLKFQKNGGAAIELRTASILSASTGQEDKQIGGIPVVLGRAATPFGGGRVIALFSHKKYDMLTLKYQDNDGAVHGAIFQLAKGQAQLIQGALAANGVQISEAEVKKVKGSTEERSENK